MALSRTNLLGEASTANFGFGAFTTSSFTPPSNSLLVVGEEAIEDGGDADFVNQLTIADSAGLTWTRRRDAVGGGPSFSTAVVIWTAPVTAGASMTLTVDAGARQVNHYAVSVVAYTGHNAGAPIGTSGENFLNSGFGSSPVPASLTLDAAPASTSEVFAVIGEDGVGPITPGTGWTEIHETTASGSYFGFLQSQTRSGSTSATVGWDDIRASGGNIFNYAAVAAEITQGEAFAFRIRQNNPLR